MSKHELLSVFGPNKASRSVPLSFIQPLPALRQAVSRSVEGDPPEMNRFRFKLDEMLTFRTDDRLNRGE